MTDIKEKVDAIFKLEMEIKKSQERIKKLVLAIRDTSEYLERQLINSNLSERSKIQTAIVKLEKAFE
jgi:hypothetical protein